MTRKEMYLRAAMWLFKQKGGLSTYCCKAIAHVHLKDEGCFDDIKRTNFPEFFLFKDKNGKFGWFGNPKLKENQDARVIALLLCAQMCKD